MVERIGISLGKDLLGQFDRLIADKGYASASAPHVHMDPHNCLEVQVLRGPAGTIMRMGDGLVATKGVEFGKLVPATTGEGLR